MTSITYYGRIACARSSSSYRMGPHPLCAVMPITHTGSSPAWSSSTYRLFATRLASFENSNILPRHP
ncbi:hypothetical protein M430DRAFT_34910 [Amorphotheca resinae ATCC 22711]|uniref:Uncharacterized protein n=1 Tax=Amorphotheca resinae ATCC 22711 TaxID=857342 RepID=A0A2T3B181_AMORE|nr:hypothetical protein M430DRAFT_34910 [Amorphotheca resinae ATCC 22711]PSS18289.1 hypothetical protein M430DRAFT_34910 [Amorphotheca resinae ATCC 22711]